MGKVPLTCKGVVIVCEDFRLHQRPDGRNLVAELIKQLGFDCDLITRAGGILDLIRPEDVGEGFDASLLRDVKISSVLHKATKIILIGHEDCGAYEYLHLKNSQMELSRIQVDLRRAKIILAKLFPQAEVDLYIARLTPGSIDKFKLKELSIA